MLSQNQKSGHEKHNLILEPNRDVPNQIPYRKLCQPKKKLENHLHRPFGAPSACWGESLRHLRKLGAPKATFLPLASLPILLRPHYQDTFRTFKTRENYTPTHKHSHWRGGGGTEDRLLLAPPISVGMTQETLSGVSTLWKKGRGGWGGGGWFVFLIHSTSPLVFSKSPRSQAFACRSSRKSFFFFQVSRPDIPPHPLQNLHIPDSALHLT